MSENYTPKPLMAFEDRNDAVKAACAVHDLDASGVSKYIKTIPVMCDQPAHIDTSDLQTVISMAIDATIKANEAVGAMIAKPLLDMLESEDGDAE